MSVLSESTPLLPSFRSAHQKSPNTPKAPVTPRVILAFFFWPFVLLTRLLSQQTTDPILPTVAPSPPPAPDLPDSANSPSQSEKSVSQATFPKDSVVVVIARSELPSTTYPASSLKKTPSYDSIPPMKEIRSVRFSAIIDIHEFSRLAGEPVGMVPISKAPGVKFPQIENELRHGSQARARLALELEPVPLKSSYNHKLIDDGEYNSQSRYGSPIY